MYLYIVALIFFAYCYLFLLRAERGISSWKLYFVFRWNHLLKAIGRNNVEVQTPAEGTEAGLAMRPSLRLQEHQNERHKFSHGGQNALSMYLRLGAIGMQNFDQFFNSVDLT